jgi:cell division protease FtsH
MVTEWGMSERLGAVNFDSGRRNRFLDVPQGPERGPHSEETAKAIDEEVRMLVTEAHNDARRILLDRRDILETVTRRLLEKEVMEGDELRAILGEAHPVDRDVAEGLQPTGTTPQ